MRGRSPAGQIGATVAHATAVTIWAGGVLFGRRDPLGGGKSGATVAQATGVTGGGRRQKSTGGGVPRRGV